MSAAPFGAFAPSAAQEAARRLAHHLPRSYAGRKGASLLLGPAGGRSGAAFDVAVFKSQRARLHPFDNICEKRVYLTPQHWDPEERALLASMIEAHKDDIFRFADVGANVGLYSLFARSVAHAFAKRLAAVCIEPDREMRARLAFNIAASGAVGEIAILPYAATAADGPVRFAVNVRSRGLSRVDPEGGIEVAGRSLGSIFAEAGWARIDAMKIDIEGHERPALQSFFDQAPESLWPRLVILEIAHETPDRSAAALCCSAGYETTLRTKRNSVLVRTSRISGARGDIRLRPATPADIPLLDHWDRQPHVIRGTTDDPEADKAFEGTTWRDELTAQSPYSQYFIAECDGRPIGAMQIIDPHREPTHYWGEIEANLRAIDVWIGEAGDLGRGYGETMMRLALKRSFADAAVTSVIIDPLASNLRAHKFYQRLGFKPVGPRRFGEDDCLVHRLDRAEWRWRFPEG